MAQVFALDCPALPHGLALQLMDILDEAAVPDAMAVSMDEVDEAAGLWAVRAYYETAFDLSGLAALLERRIDRPAEILAAMRFEAVEDRNWVAVSLEGLAPVRAGRFFVHGRHDRSARPVNGISLELEAAVAFGTGHHGTTKGCLVVLDELLKSTRPQRILDVGCGTGVLGIAAARATHRPVVMSDIDPLAIASARGNARVNRAAGLVSAVQAAGLSHRRIQEMAPCDLAFANILARPLVNLAPDFAGICRPGAALVLSGLYVEQERWVFSAYRNAGFVLHKRIRLGSWSTLWLMRAG